MCDSSGLIQLLTLIYNFLTPFFCLSLLSSVIVIEPKHVTLQLESLSLFLAFSYFIMCRKPLLLFLQFISRTRERKSVHSSILFYFFFDCAYNHNNVLWTLNFSNALDLYKFCHRWPQWSMIIHNWRILFFSRLEADFMHMVDYKLY